MNLETVVMGFINTEPMSGYDLSKKMDTSVGFFWHATHPQIYTCLKQLETRGYLESSREESQTGPSRKVYRITSNGKKVLLEYLAGEIQSFVGKFPLLVAMFFGAELGLDHWQKVLKIQLEEQQSQLAVYNSIHQEIPQFTPAQDLETYLRRRTLDFGIDYQKQFIRWIQTTLREMKT